MRSRFAAVVALALAGLALRCTPEPSGPQDPLQALDGLGGRDDVNLVFILIDTLRADHLSAYGYERPTSPVLEAIARGGIRFAKVRSQSSWTKPSMASLWTSNYPVRTGVLRYQHAVPQTATMPAEILREAGFKTAGIWRNGWVADNFGFGQGFDTYTRPVPSRPAEQAAGAGVRRHPPIPTDLDLTESALEFVETYGSERFFLYLHYMDVHQYVYDEASAQFGANYADAYDNAIHWVDGNVGLLLAGLKGQGVLDETLVVIAADHGEAFLEHGGEGHGRNLYREVTTVPLIFTLPDSLDPGIVVEPLVENIDVWPTILDLLGLPPLPGAQGRSLVSLIRAAAKDVSADGDAAEARSVFSHMDTSWGRRRADPRPLVSVTEGRYRLIHPVGWPGRNQLFDLERDHGEQTNVAADEPGVVDRLMASIDDYLRSPAPPWGRADEVEIDAMRWEQLRALGYLAGGARRPQAESPGE